MTVPPRGVRVEDITLVEISAKIGAAVTGGVSVRAIEEFLEGVDWSSYQSAAPEVRNLLRRIEQLMSEYSEGELDGPAFVRLLTDEAISPAAG